MQDWFCWWLCFADFLYLVRQTSYRYQCRGTLNNILRMKSSIVPKRFQVKFLSQEQYRWLNRPHFGRCWPCLVPGTGNYVWVVVITLFWFWFHTCSARIQRLRGMLFLAVSFSLGIYLVNKYGRKTVGRNTKKPVEAFHVCTGSV